MAFAAASSVAASATPVRRGGGGLPSYNPPLNPIPESKCQQQNLQCCNTATSQSDPHINDILGGVGMMNDMDPELLAGGSCLPIASGETW